MTFNDVVEAIQNLSVDEKQDVQRLLKQYLREERREALASSFNEAKLAEQQGELKFSDSITELRGLIET
jgi:hypothetical protein